MATATTLARGASAGDRAVPADDPRGEARSSSPPRSAPSSSGTTSTSTARSPRSSARSSSPPSTSTTRNIFALLAFAAGFLVRPFGALVFGRLGDLVGRKYTFLITILIMGVSTFLVGLLPSYDTIGWVAPGHPDRAAHAAGPGARRRVRRRGGLRGRACAARAARLLHELDPDHGDARPAAVARGDPGAAHLSIGEADFRRPNGGWRIPFLLSIFLLAISVWIRLQMKESPAFKKMKEEGTQSKAPLSEAFGQWKNAKVVILALLGLVVGQAVVWYTGQFYALFFLQSILKVDLLHGERADRLVADPRHRRLHLLRLAVRPDRPQADHPRRLPDRGAHLLPAVQRADERRQPAARQGARDGEGRGRRRSRRLRLGVRPGRHPHLHRALRRRPRGARPLGHHLRAGPGSGRLAAQGDGQRQGSRRSTPRSRRASAAFAAAAVAAGYPEGRRSRDRQGQRVLLGARQRGRR